jgi:2-dehydropantoate 2-reductase
VRILIFGTGVIGSVYGERLLAARHDVVLLARGGRLRDLRESGLVLQDAQTGHRTALPVTVVAGPEPGDQFDLVVAPVRRDQLPDTIPLLTALSKGPEVLFFGNALGRVSELASSARVLGQQRGVRLGRLSERIRDVVSIAAALVTGERWWRSLRAAGRRSFSEPLSRILDAAPCGSARARSGRRSGAQGAINRAGDLLARAG